jgi:hypothetical protein
MPRAHPTHSLTHLISPRPPHPPRSPGLSSLLSQCPSSLSNRFSFSLLFRIQHTQTSCVQSCTTQPWITSKRLSTTTTTDKPTTTRSIDSSSLSLSLCVCVESIVDSRFCFGTRTPSRLPATVWIWISQDLAHSEDGQDILFVR